MSDTDEFYAALQLPAELGAVGQREYGVIIQRQSSMFQDASYVGPLKTPEVLIGENQYKKTGSSFECRFLFDRVLSSVEADQFSELHKLILKPA